jgi:hypothetical protein
LKTEEEEEAGDVVRGTIIIIIISILKDNSKFTALRVPNMSPLVLLAQARYTQGQTLGIDKVGD